MKLTIDNFKSMMNLSLANVKAREEEFSKLDAIAGDGDHGTAIVTALTIIAGDAQQGTEFPAMLNDMGMGVMMKTSGSTSTLLGALFMGMGEALEPLGVTDELNAAQVKVMFRGGLTGVEEQTKAKLGDKTMMDALVPAVVAIESCDSEDVKELSKAGAAKISPTTEQSSIPSPTYPLRAGSCPDPPIVTIATLSSLLGCVRTTIFSPPNFTLSW